MTLHGNASFRWAHAPGVLILVQAPGTPSEAAWREFLLQIPSESAVLVVGRNNNLAPNQRADVEQYMRRNAAQVAVLTASLVTRGVITALGWLGLPVKPFHPTDLADALAFLKLPAEAESEVRSLISRLEHALIRSERSEVELSGRG